MWNLMEKKMDKIKCPVCNKSLKTITYEKQEVDVCQTCGGIWFDKGELLEVISNLLFKDKVEFESIGKAYKKKAVASKDLNPSQRCCPRCKVCLESFNYSYDSNVFLDRCPSCLGIWADSGEVKRIAKYIKGNPEMNKFAEALASELKKTSKLSSKKGKIAAVIISLLYLTAFSLLGGLEGFLRILMFLVLPLACIFFGEELGSLTGIRFALGFCRPVVTKSTPGFLVVLGGWIVLLLPLFVLICFAITGV
jgi:Zn-finger nucleic acid-binding protein